MTFLRRWLWTANALPLLIIWRQIRRKKRGEYAL